jgi:hypothetical protein
MLLMASFGGVATLGVGFPASLPMASGGSPDQNSCNLLSKTNKFCLGALLLLCLVLELRKTFSSRIEPRTVFGVVAFVSIISSSKQTTLV